MKKSKLRSTLQIKYLTQLTSASTVWLQTVILSVIVQKLCKCIKTLPFIVTEILIKSWKLRGKHIKSIYIKQLLFSTFAETTTEMAKPLGKSDSLLQTVSLLADLWILWTIISKLLLI